MINKLLKLPLLPKILIAIALGSALGLIAPVWLTRVFITINGIFGNFLNFTIPLIILALVAPGIASLGRGAGKLLLMTAILAYGFTIFSGFFTFLSCEAVFPWLLSDDTAMSLTGQSTTQLTSYFTIEMPPLMGVMTALISAFIIGLGLSVIKGDTLQRAMEDFKDIISLVITKVIIPLLPLYIFGIFLNMSASGEVASVMSVFIKIIIFIFILTFILLLIQFSVAGAISKRNPIKLLKKMIPAYVTALGTQSSVATIPVTLEQTIKNGIKPELAGFVIPLCATIHLSGSTLKIVACSMAIMLISNLPLGIDLYWSFIMMLGIAMIAAPGVPGGAIMASIGLLESMLGFSEEAIGLMIALYIAMDSFGTACNVTGDGAIAVIMDSVTKKHNNK